MAMEKDPVLFNDWHVVARSQDLKPGTVMGTRLLDRDLVLWRGQTTQVLAWDDRCPHRSVRLSVGRVVNDGLVCSYHGMVYNPEGRCVYVPSHPDYVPPKQACIQTYKVQERYGLVFVCLGEPSETFPPFQSGRMQTTEKSFVDRTTAVQVGFRRSKIFWISPTFPLFTAIFWEIPIKQELGITRF